MLYNYNSSSNSKSFINLETKLKSGEKAYIDKSRGHVRQKVIISVNILEWPIWVPEEQAEGDQPRPATKFEDESNSAWL